MDSISPILWTGDSLRLLDQRKLPGEEIYVEISEPEEVIRAIADMVVRGAPAIGVTAGFGVALASQTVINKSHEEAVAYMKEFCSLLGKSRPTAVNLITVVDRMLKVIDKLMPYESMSQALIKEADNVQNETLVSDMNMAELGSKLIDIDSTVLTHCNTGPLATSGYGTALGVIRRAWELGRIKHVFATETRPWFQGSRLTMWELKRLGVPATLVVDSAIGHLMNQGYIDCVLVGADRITANGDVANKIGTLNLAIIANSLGIPFFVVAPVTTLDSQLLEGTEIHIEERDPREITELFGESISPPEIDSINFAFDVTPNDYIDAIITDLGIVKKPYINSIKDLNEYG
ncbi:MAG: S-methyl-5-thioribose-1-phosphate isomerase [Dehalococcoidia bacterium]|nr:S-methyl-5-thioribose-1-phosphate isomerase [Dehalococcoidia bacterium]